ncbi:ABC transporter ATP-binding protein [Pyramidobacter sp. SM-530-WT-4B]|uniref:ABC transporter ATP-binding protein n=1 Tax=Pyramidobacter porci TaxID=2605789 RepID=A0A6L5YD36_9BACT|nr:ABC transporter ATP-binding protein [Pyramidobacter porci]MCI6261328.1 ABC transporter ATP-binding protein [Pyramidobacter sp.]MST56055.1 ABC transporter ATP-binding protein [Pyramidobacter porci]
MAGLLEVKQLCVSYGAIRALDRVSLSIPAGEIVSVIGANGAGKSTLMSAVMGQVSYQSGEIEFEGKPLPRRSFQVVKSGISLSPEGRRIFAPLTVLENLQIGAFPRSGDSEKAVKEDMDWVFSLFPRLEERIGQYAGTLSGGEQQMLAVARALMSRPKLLLLDEPSLGLAPVIIKDIFRELRRINEKGLTILLVEQNAKQALLLSQHAFVLQTGRIVKQGVSRELLSDPEIAAAYLGGK